MKNVERREYINPGLVPRRNEYWIVDDESAWLVQCMDCGTRIGTVNVGNEQGAVRLTTDHNKTLHL